MAKSQLALLAVICLALSCLQATAIDPLPYKQSEIAGKYVVTQIGTNLPKSKFEVEIDGAILKVAGCGKYSSGYVYDIATRSFRLDPFTISSSCPTDDDGEVTKAFANARKVYKNGKELVCEDGQGAIVLRSQVPNIVNVVTPAPPSKGTAPPFVDAIKGRYELSLAAMELTILKNVYTFKGCNTFTFDASYGENKSVKFGPVSATKITCKVDFDSFYLQAFNLARYLLQIQTGYRLLNENSRLLLEFVLQPSGLFLVSVPSVTLTVDDSTFSFEGCNAHSIQYTISKESEIKFGNFLSTKRFCLFFDYDAYIIQTFLLSARYEIKSKAIVLKTQQNEILAFVLYENLGIAAPVIPAPVSTITGNPAAVQPSAVPLTSIPITVNPIPFIIGIPVVVAPTPVVTFPTVNALPEYPGKPYVVSTHICEPVTSADSQTILPPKVVLPGVEHTSLKGTYKLESLSVDLPPIFIKVDDEYIEFDGCNINRIPYAVYTDGVFVVLEGAASTKRACAIDRDLEYKQLIKSANKFKKSDTGYVLLQNENAVANANLKIRNQIVKYNILNGGYQIEVVGIDASISDTEISFQGCNTVSIPYKLLAYGGIEFGAPVSTKIFCDRDVDPFYIKAITSAKNIKETAQGYTLVDGKDENIRLTAFSGNQKHKLFNGRFRMELPFEGFRLKVFNGQFTLSGCNEHNFNFSLADSGAIVFGNPTSTKVPCSVNNDNVFLFKLLKAQSIIVTGNTIIFNSGNNEQVAKATNFDIKENKDVVQIIDPKSPVVTVTEYKLAPGNYTFSVLRTSFKKVTLTVEGNKISFKGCNINTMTYLAASDGTIRFYKGASTLIACKDDYDSFYVDALLATRKYVEMKGMYTFFDAKGKSVITFLANFDFNILPEPIQNPVASYTTTVATTGGNTTTIITGNLSATTTTSNATTGGSAANLTTSNVSNGSTSAVDITTIVDIDLKGKFKFQLPRIGLQILDNSFIFRGCNTHRLPYTYKNADMFFGKPISSNNKCQNDSNDDFFLNLIPQIFTFKREGNRCTFFNSRLQSLFSADLVETARKDAKPQTSITLKQGSYKAELPSVDVQFDDQSLSFRGCRNIKLDYKGLGAGKFTFLEGKRSNPCPIKYDDIFQNSIKSSTKCRKIDNGFSFYDEDGNEKGSCIFSSW